MAKSLVCHHCGFTPSDGTQALHCPKDGMRLVPVEEHEKSPHDPYLGRTLGERYALVGLLGEGAMGAVYLARQMPLDREVAIKVIRPMALSGNTKSREQLAQRFLREAQLQADFNHHAVVTVLDFGAEPDATLFMVMERLHGVPLSQVMADGLEPQILVGMVLQLLDALGRFHDRGMIHRDIKPDNLMVLDGPPAADGMPRVKLLDFGIAKSIRDRSNTKLTQDGTVFGTPEYMAPEQAMGVPEMVDQRCDLYAVGAVLSEGLTGQPPFTGNSPLAILHRVVSGQVPPLPDTVEPALAAVVLKALAKEREGRYEDARAMAEALAQSVGLGRDRPVVNTGRNRLPSGPQAPANPAATSGAPAVALGAEETVPDSRFQGGELATAAPAAAPRNRASLQPRPPAEAGPPAAPLPGGARDPRDVFAVRDPNEPDSAELLLRGQRRRWPWVVGVVALAGAGAAAFFALRPGPPPAAPVSNEPVRVQVNARFDNEAESNPATPASK
jgi:serine/threonine-protein kinase